MRPSSHFRVAFLVLTSNILFSVVTPLTQRCKEMCREKGKQETDAFEYDCGFGGNSQACGYDCRAHCSWIADCDSRGNVQCPKETATGTKSTELTGGALIGAIIGGIILLAICAGAIGACIYCCCRQQRVGQQPMMMGGAMGPTPQGSYQPQQMQPTGAYGQQQPMGGYGQQQPQPQPQQQMGGGNPFLSQQQSQPPSNPTA